MLKKKYRYLLFDLDRTLWDFDTNSRNNIYNLLDDFGFSDIDKGGFFELYDKINHRLWGLYETGKLTKEELRWKRFMDTFAGYGVDDIQTATAFGNAYLEKMPLQTALMPHAREVLNQLYNNGCKMAIISNGFREVQYRKLNNTGIAGYFDAVLISEEQGLHKPSPVLFKRALKAIGGKKEEALMVGDDFANDIEGAMIFGIDQFFYNYKQIPCDGGPTYNSGDLRDLLTFEAQQQRDPHHPS